MVVLVMAGKFQDIRTRLAKLDGMTLGEYARLCGLR